MLLERIKEDRIAAIKAKEAKAETLTTLLSEVQRIDKVDQEDDSKVEAVVRKFKKGLVEMIACTDGEKKASLESEMEIVSAYLPQMLEGAELEAAVDKAVEESGAETPKDMGKVMKALKEAHGNNYDGKTASQLVRSKLA